MPRGDRTQPLQERGIGALGNLSDRYYRAGNVEGMKSINQQMQNRLQNSPTLRPGTGGIFNTSPMEGGSIDPRSFWNVGLQSGDDTGIMSFGNAAMTDYSPNARGRWMTQSPTGNKLLSYLTSKFGSEGSSEYLQDVIGEGGFPLLGGTVRPIWEDGNYGIEGNWSW